VLFDGQMTTFKYFTIITKDSGMSTQNVASLILNTAYTYWNRKSLYLSQFKTSR